MNPDPVSIALWIGSLVLAGDPTYDPFPPALDELAAAYYQRFRPHAKA